MFKLSDNRYNRIIVCKKIMTNVTYVQYIYLRFMSNLIVAAVFKWLTLIPNY